MASEKSQTHSLVTSLRDAVLVVNRDREVALANRAMANLLGGKRKPHFSAGPPPRSLRGGGEVRTGPGGPAGGNKKGGGL